MPNPNSRRVELHTHSTASDGAFAPERVANLCAEAGVEVWALTDHDNCDGCARAARAADRYGIEFIPGIEISAYLDRSIHILGYGVRPDSRVVEELSVRLRDAREERMREMLERLEDLGVSVPPERVTSLADGAPLSRAHLAEAMVREEVVADTDEAFERWIGADAPGYLPVGWPSVPTAIDQIHRAGGAAVLAHPGRYDVDAHLSDWVDAGLDGIEVDHPRHDPGDAANYGEFAEEHGLVATVSSDFHGWDHVSADFFGDVWLEEGQLRDLRAAIAAQR